MASTSKTSTSGSTAASRIRTLSKSDFKLARTCDAKLYFRENGFPDNRAFDAYLAFLAEGGYMAEALAKARYQDGIQLEYGRDTADDHRRTLEHLQRDNVVLFEATLMSGRRLARADVLEKRGNSIRLIEVKAKSINGAEHREKLSEGGKGLFWTRKKNPTIVADWREKLEDITFQALILERMLPGITVRPILALIDKSKRAAIDNIPSLFAIDFEDRPDGTRRLRTAHYTGDLELLPQLDLITEFDVNEEVTALRDEVDAAARHFEEMLDSPLSAFLDGLPRGAKCASCEFRDTPAGLSGFAECWGHLANGDPHFLELHAVGRAHGPGWAPLVDWMWSERKSGLVEIPVDSLAKKDGSVGPEAARQRRQVEYTKSGERFIAPSLRNRIQSIEWPAHFIDFETSRLALPSHARMRPYGVVTFQWSCHTVAAPGTPPQHSQWLNTQDLWPNQSFAEALRATIGDSGAVVTWSAFENVTLKQIVADLAEFGRNAPDLVEWLHSVEARIVDMHVWARDDFYHPAMGGSTSIKRVMDALWQNDAQLREQFEEWTGISADGAVDPYHALAEITIHGSERVVRDGTEAMRAYDAMMYGPGRSEPEIAARWARLLRQYCHLDTLSMVLIFEHWRRAVGLA